MFSRRHSIFFLFILGVMLGLALLAPHALIRALQFGIVFSVALYVVNQLNPVYGRRLFGI